jgi:tRNA dimethylallyltransferase
LRLISARPSEDDEARVPHRLYGYRDAAHPCSAAAWAADAKREVAAAQEAGRLPILAGGTGLYIRTLLEGIAPVPEIDPVVRAEVRTLPVAEAHEALAREDPPAVARLRPTDTTRIARHSRSCGRPGARSPRGRKSEAAESAGAWPSFRLSSSRRETGSTPAAMRASRK